MTTRRKSPRYQVLVDSEGVKTHIEHFTSKKAALVYQVKQIKLGKKANFWDTLDNPMSNLFRF